MIDPLVTGLPASPDAERLVLGAMMLDGVQFPLIRHVIERHDFSEERHARIWDAIENLDGRGTPIDAYTVGEELQTGGKLESVGGLSYLASLLDGLPRSTGLDPHVRIIRDKSVKRQAILACQAAMDRLLLDGDSDQALAFAEAMFSKLQEAQQRGRRRMRSVQQVIDDTGMALLDPSKVDAGRPVVTIPFPTLAEVFPRMCGGQLIVAGARTSVGKTSFATGLAYHAARNCHCGVAVFSVEMGVEDLVRRMFCGVAAVDSHKMARGWLSSAERHNLARGASEVAPLPIYLGDSSICTVPAVRAAVSQVRAERSIGLIVVDYLQLLESTGRRENRNQEITEISRGLKRLAVEFDVAVLALAQLNRENERQSRKPRLSDLRDSGSIEQDADVVLLLAPVESGDQAEGAPIDVEFNVAKQRPDWVPSVEVSQVIHEVR